MRTIDKISKILLVDDDEVNNFFNKSLLTRQLQFKGEIKICVNGKEALEYLETEIQKGIYNSPDLIFLDINMPVMNGFEFMTHYEQLPENMKAKIVVCMLTSSLNEEDIEKAQQFDSLREYIHKPLGVEECLSIIEKHIKN